MQQPAEFEIRPYGTGDEEAINRTFNAVFGRGRSAAEWRWKFRPEADGSWIVIALDRTGEIVAQFAALARRVLVDGRRYTAGHTVDVFCRPMPGSVAGRVYLKTAREFFRRCGPAAGADFLYGFPADRAMRLGRAKLGYARPVPVRVFTRRGPRPWVMGARIPGWAGRIERRVGVGPEGVSRLWERAASRYPVAAVRDGAWIEQRYRSHPESRYVTVAAGDRSNPAAWAAFAVRGRTTRWMDLVWDGRDRRAIETLDDAALDVAAAAGSARLEVWLSGDDEAAGTLVARGWRETETPLALTAVTFGRDLDGDDLARRFYITIGDSDHA